jgi:hypothetical protein
MKLDEEQAELAKKEMEEAIRSVLVSNGLQYCNENRIQIALAIQDIFDINATVDTLVTKAFNKIKHKLL